MYEVTVESSFAAAHRLREYDGNCERLHGHNWKVEVTLRGAELDPLGMLVDFRAAKAAIMEAIGELDHKYLNETAWFTAQNPTTENLAREIYRCVARTLAERPGVGVARVRVWESDACSATYAEGK